MRSPKPPSARSQGEPLTGRFNIVAGEGVEHVIMWQHDTPLLLASDSGYGFVTSFKEMVSKNKNGKALLSLPTGSKVMSPVNVIDRETDLCLAISNEGRMLVFPIVDLPVLSKGKGNKLINIPSARAASREEILSHVSVLPTGASVKLTAGKRSMTLSVADIEHYRGDRGRRGNKLPRGLQRVDSIEIIQKQSVIEGD